MKSRVRLLNEGVLVLVLLMVSAGAWFFVRKFKDKPVPLDEVKSALGGLRDRLTSRDIIGCMSYSGLAEAENEVANALVPAQVLPRAKRDTTLFVFKADVTDSMWRTLTAGRQTIWAVQSEHFHFVLNRKLR